MGRTHEIPNRRRLPGPLPSRLACSDRCRMGNTDQLLPGQWQRRKTLAGWHDQWIQSIEKRCVLSEFFLGFYGFCYDVLDFEILGANTSHVTRDEFVQFLCIVIPGEQGECVRSEVFEGLRTTSSPWPQIIKMVTIHYTE